MKSPLALLKATHKRSFTAILAASAAAIFGTLATSGCASSDPTVHGTVQGQPYTAKEWLQSDGNRITQDAMLSNESSMLLLAEKLYRRNPTEWRKTAPTLELALQAVSQSILETKPWPGLQGKHDVDALSLSLSPDFVGDRVAAFIIACDDTIVTAHGGKRTFYYLDGVDPQHVFNAARDMEIALWLLHTRRDRQGRPLLLASEIGPTGRNLSFDLEFGKMIGRLDLLADYMTERYRRAGINYIQGMVMAPVLAFLPVH